MTDVKALDLPVDHPGFDDPTYRRRRAEIAAAADSWQSGQPIPIVDYRPDEHRVWQQVSSELRPRHRQRCCAAFLDGAEALGLPDDHIPQLREVDDRLRSVSGFSLAPVPGLVPARTFYGSLAEGTFLSTQYVRHTSVPFYTPEPDVIHEVVGHVNLLANPIFAQLHLLAGEASRRCVGEAAHDFFSRVFWFTLEFGTVWEDGQLKAYGAGLASSFGELEAFRHAQIRPFDLVGMGTLDYDITRYQPVLFAAPSIEHLAERLGAFFSEFDDAAHEHLMARRRSA